MNSALDKFKKLTDTLAQKTRMGKRALLCAALLALGLILLAVSSLPQLEQFGGLRRNA